MGVLYSRQKAYKKSRDFYKKALEIEYKKENDPYQISTVIINKNSPHYGKTITELVLTNWNNHKRRNNEILKLTGDKKRGKQIYDDLCSNKCHQPQGWGLIDGSYPQIAGQYASVQIKQLLDIREGNRDNPTMFRFSLPSEIGGYQAIADVAAYIEDLPMIPNNGVGPGVDLETGEKLYLKLCAKCHGKQGEGNDKEFYPRIHGQHYNYLLRQVQWMKENKRRNVHPLKMMQLDSISDRDLRIIIDYVSTLKPPQSMIFSDKKYNQIINPEAPQSGSDEASTPLEQDSDHSNDLLLD
ncbi:MAG: c-type cytochrome [Magnetococcales bacterium]|nr:c-type cytochrome [Magnetococcales bacterium]